MGGRLAVAILIVAGCRPAGEPLETHSLYVMATRVDVTLPADAAESDPQAVSEIERLLRVIERDYYAWSDGELAAVNSALSERRRADASDAMADLLARARLIAEQSDRSFDPGVGALVELWGFHRGEPAGDRPASAAIAAARQNFGSILDLTIDGQSIAVRPDATAAAFLLDLGGIAKGAAVDRVIDYLRAADLGPALVNAGGDLRVLGNPPDRRWRVGIQDPRGAGLIGSIALDDGESAFTSGDYERYFEEDGDRLHHILDPRSGEPVRHTRAVTVVADDGTTADAAATALLVAGPARWQTVAAALGVDDVLRVDASGRIDMTAAMRDRFQESAGLASDIIVVGN